MNDPMRLTGILSGLVILVCCSLMIPAAFEIHGLAGLAVFIAATLGAFLLLGASREAVNTSREYVIIHREGVWIPEGKF